MNKISYIKLTMFLFVYTLMCYLSTVFIWDTNQEMFREVVVCIYFLWLWFWAVAQGESWFLNKKTKKEILQQMKEDNNAMKEMIQVQEDINRNKDKYDQLAKRVINK